MKYSLESMRQEFKKGTKLNYVFFWGHQASSDKTITKSCFSQWWSIKFHIEDIEYNCMEQYMMAEKARLFNDNNCLMEIMKANSPKKIKTLGRLVKNFNDNIWKQKRYQIVLKGNIEKFLQNKNLLEFLLQTKDKIIVEASPYDKVWGIGMSADNKSTENPLFWKGENLLGFALMEVRDKLKES